MTLIHLRFHMSLFSHPVNLSQILASIWWQDPIIKPFTIYSLQIEFCILVFGEYYVEISLKNFDRIIVESVKSTNRTDWTQTNKQAS